MPLITDEIRTFLQAPLLARMSTIGADGYPHTIPVWFILDQDELVIISDRNTVKVKHIAANPKGAVVIGGEPSDGAGYLFKGDYRIEEDPDFTWMKTLTRRYEAGEQAERDIVDWSRRDMIIIRLRPTRVIKI